MLQVQLLVYAPVFAEPLLLLVSIEYKITFIRTQKSDKKEKKSEKTFLKVS